MSDRDGSLYVRDMLDSIIAIESYLVGIDQEYFALDRKTFSATLRELEIIGEAAGKIRFDPCPMFLPQVVKIKTSGRRRL